MPSAISASSNENQQPMTKLTRSSRQRSFRHQVAVPPHAIARQIEANVEVLAEFRHARIALGRGADQRTRLRIELAEPQKSLASGAGRMARLLCTKPGASLAVGPRWPPPYREPRFV